MNTVAANLLAEAQELLDQRLDPLNHADFAERLADCPEALDQVIALRALALSMPAQLVAPPKASPRPVLFSRQLWLAPLVAAAALLVMLNTEQEGIPASAPGPELIVQAPPPDKAVITPAVLHFSQSTESTTLSPPPAGDLRSLSITSSRTTRP